VDVEQLVLTASPSAMHVLHRLYVLHRARRPYVILSYAKR
jgi:hypothetical protein